LNHDFSSIA